MLFLYVLTPLTCILILALKMGQVCFTETLVPNYNSAWWPLLMNQYGILTIILDRSNCEDNKKEELCTQSGLMHEMLSKASFINL